MIIHAHHSSDPITGEMKRIININKDVAGYLSNKIIEVEFYSVRVFKFVYTKGQFTLSEKVIKKHYVPNIERLGFLNEIWCFIVVAFFLLKYKPTYYIEEWKLPIGIKTLVKFLSKRTKVVLDLHGAAPEEHEYSFGCKNTRLEKKDKKSSRSADYIICQSNEMKRHLIQKYALKTENIVVYRCGVDTNIFFYDTNIRSSIRKELGIEEGEILFVYSGGMHKWQKIKEAFFYFIGFHNEYPESKMLVLTRDVNGLNTIIDDNKFINISESLIVKALSYNEVPAYLCAADIAFLLRDNVIMNAVASPTKLAEYMICGLPVISSDVAEKWVDEKGMIYIYDIRKSDYSIIRKEILKIDKLEISRYSQNTMSLNIDRQNIKSFFAQSRKN